MLDGLLTDDVEWMHLARGKEVGLQERLKWSPEDLGHIHKILFPGLGALGPGPVVCQWRRGLKSSFAQAWDVARFVVCTEGLCWSLQDPMNRRNGRTRGLKEPREGRDD